MRKLKESHPTMQKLAQLEALADELGISIEFSGYSTFVNDLDHGEFVMQDTDNPRQPLTTWPHGLEYRLVFEDDAE